MDIDKFTTIDIWKMLNKEEELIAFMLDKPKLFIQWVIRNKHDLEKKACLIELKILEFIGEQEELTNDQFLLASARFGRASSIFNAIYNDLPYKELILEAIKPETRFTYGMAKTEGLVKVDISKTQLAKIAFNCQEGKCKMAGKLGVWANGELIKCELEEEYVKVYNRNRALIFIKMKKIVPSERWPQLEELLTRMDIRKLHSASSEA
ncbi:MAG TPA: hypothetical protein ENI61_01130 [Ignavibacteria bacterium]|nr:hypothetical protein [Ignavibacteria bacterium]